MNISIINYKHFSGRHITFESNGIGKEYYGETDILIFEGEYLNGERNGKGKEYDDEGNLKFEGEYLNGKRNGKGKEYVGNILIFEGEYLNDLKWNGKWDNKRICWKWFDIWRWIFKWKKNGKGKEYDYDGIILFDGEYLNGKRNGKAKEYDDEGNLKFDGIYLNDLKWNGKGYDKSCNVIYELKDGNGFIKE